MTTQAAMMLAALAGIYSGDGTWHDEGGDSKRYHIEMSIEVLPSGEVQQWFKHVFYEENDAVIEQKLVYTPVANGIFSLKLVGAPVAGRGYCGVDLCHYSLSIPGNQVEVTQVFSGNGRIRGFGSAEKNAQGRHIWWEENLGLQRRN